MDEPLVKTYPISSKNLIGVSVKNYLGEELGEISEILIDHSNGCVTNLLLETGLIGFKKHIAIPWDMLKFEDDHVLINVERDFIDRLPAYQEN